MSSTKCGKENKHDAGVCIQCGAALVKRQALGESAAFCQEERSDSEPQTA